MVHAVGKIDSLGNALRPVIVCVKKPNRVPTRRNSAFVVLRAVCEWQLLAPAAWRRSPVHNRRVPQGEYFPHPAMRAHADVFDLVKHGDAPGVSVFRKQRGDQTREVHHQRGPPLGG